MFALTLFHVVEFNIIICYKRLFSLFFSHPLQYYYHFFQYTRVRYIIIQNIEQSLRHEIFKKNQNKKI